MDEIAPEYDVVVLGTGKLQTPHGGAPRILTDVPRVDGMRALWVMQEWSKRPRTLGLTIRVEC